MFALALAVAAASVLGSLHCVGMCGPFALWATAGGSSVRSITAYHLGRLTTYLSAGLIAGGVGSALTIGGNFAGVQSLAAQVAGGLLIFVGISRLLLMIPFFQGNATLATTPARWTAILHRAKPFFQGQGPLARAYAGGLLTTWLPCGWLYLFVLVAAGTGAVSSALVVMLAFWVGTLPALTALVVGARSMIPRFRPLIPIAASLILIATGMYTASGRASADLSAMVSPNLGSHPDRADIIGLTAESLPCCPQPLP